MSENEYLKWRNLIGDFILEFAHVEVEVFGIFEDVGRVDDIERAKSYQFKERATKAMDLIDREIKDPIDNYLLQVTTTQPASSTQQ